MIRWQIPLESPGRSNYLITQDMKQVCATKRPEKMKRLGERAGKK